MADFPELTYDLVTIGEEFVSNDHLITPEDVATYAFAVDDYHDFFFGASPFAAPVAHPTLLGNQALHLRHSKYVVHAGLHAQMEFNFLQPLQVGMRVRSHGKIIDKYMRRGKEGATSGGPPRDPDMMEHVWSASEARRRPVTTRYSMPPCPLPIVLPVAIDSLSSLP